MQFMVIETFRNQDAKAIYRRLAERGRMMPDGLEYVSSYVSADLSRCFQLMASDDITLLQRWVAEWSDLAMFEIVPVVSGADTRELAGFEAVQLFVDRAHSAAPGFSLEE